MKRETFGKFVGVLVAIAAVVVIVVVVTVEETKSSSSSQSFNLTTSSSTGLASPTLTTPLFDLKASSFADGEAVSNWNNSGYSFTTYTAFTNPPIAHNPGGGVQPYVAFTANNSLYCAAPVLGSNVTFMLVVQLPSNAFTGVSNMFIWSSNQYVYYFEYSTSTGLVSSNNGFAASNDQQLTTPNYYIFFIVINATSLTQTIYTNNAAPVATGTYTGPSSLQGLTINGNGGTGNPNPTLLFNWNAVEIAAWNASLTTEEIQLRASAIVSNYPDGTFTS